MLSFWIWAPVVVFVLATTGVCVWARACSRQGRRDWKRADRSARLMLRALRLPRRVL